MGLWIESNFQGLASTFGSGIVALRAERKGASRTSHAEPTSLGEVVVDSLHVQTLPFPFQTIWTWCLFGLRTSRERCLPTPRAGRVVGVEEEDSACQRFLQIGLISEGLSNDRLLS